MSRNGWILFAVVGVVVVGFLVVNSTGFNKLGKSSSSHSTLTDVASIFNSTSSIFGDVEKAFPSWFSGSGGSTPSDADLNSYASTAGFASVPDYTG